MYVVSSQSLMVAKAKEDLEQELVDKEEEKMKYLEEKAPPIQTTRMSLEELKVQWTTSSFHFARHRIMLQYNM